MRFNYKWLGLRNNSIHYKFIRVLIILFIFSLVTYVFLFLAINNRIYLSELQKQNQKQLEQISIKYQLKIQNMQSTVWQLSYDDEFIQSIYDFENSYDSKTNLMKYIHKLLSYYDSFSSVYLYINDNNSVMSTNLGYKQFDIFFDKYPIEYMLSQKHNMEILNVRNIEYLNKNERYISIIVSVPLNKEYVSGIIVVNIDSDKFFSTIIEEQGIEGSSEIILCDEKGYTLYSSNNVNEYGKAILNEREIVNIEDDINHVNHVSGNNITSIYYSKQNNMYFIIDTVISDIYHPFQSISNILLYFIIVLVIVFIFIIILFSRLFKPLRRIVKAIVPLNNKNQEEFHVIDQYINKMHNENSNLKQKLDDILPIYKESLLCDLFLNRDYSIPEITQKFDYYNININLDNYVVLAVKISFYDDISEESINIIRLSIQNTINSFFDDDYEGFCAYIQKDIIGIAIHIPKKQKNKEIEYAWNFARLLLSSVGDSISIVIGIGNLVDSVQDLSQSYYDCLDTFHYIKTSNESIISIFQINNASINSFKYPYMKEKQLINTIKTGEYEESCKILRDFFSEFNKYPYISDYEIEYITLQILTAIQRIIYENSLDRNSYDIVDFMLELQKKQSLSDVENEISKLIKKIIEDIGSNRREKEVSLKNNIIQYIEENFNKYILLTDVAEQFSVSRVYVGHIVKSYTGLNFNDLINVKKINYAKELLISTKLTIKEIGEMVGYSYSYYFCKIFKKLEGITPGEYRDINS